MPSPKINATKNYRLFVKSAENRPTDLAKHRDLRDSMKAYGFLACYPIVCQRDSKKQLVVQDGQHRLTLAESMGLPVYWVEEDQDFDIATINCTSKVWNMKDFAMTHASKGNEAYESGLDFCETHGLPIGLGFAMLAGTSSFSAISNSFKNGMYKISDPAYAHAVASLYVPLIRLSPDLRNSRFLQACMAVCRVEDFDSSRLIQNALRCREKLASYSTREAYLGLLEEVYNFGRAKLCGLKASAKMAMRDRNAAEIKKREKRNRQVAKA